METAVQANDLLALGRLLEERLNSELPLTVPIQIKCVLQDGTLLVLGQDASHDDQPEPIFSLLQDSIEALKITFPGSIWQETEQVCLYLRASGDRQPFAVREFQLEKSTNSSGSGKEESDDNSISDNSLENIFKWDSEEVEIQPSQLDIHQNLADPSQEIDRDLTPPSDSGSDPMENLSLEEPITESKSDSNSLPSEEIPQPKGDRTAQKRKLSPLTVKLGAGVAAIGVLAGLYAITRPCTIGKCTNIETAKQLNQTSVKEFKKAKNEQDIRQGRKHLTQSVKELVNIPFWSSYHPAAQKLLQTYQSQVANVDPVLIALNQAEIAAEKSQTPVQTLQYWQENQGLWQQAIASLKRVRPNTPLYPFTTIKLKEYQGNLSIINDKIEQEKQAEIKLTMAKKTAQLAQVRQSAAKTLNHWQQVQSTWEAALNFLNSIPKNTIAYQEAQPLLDNYNSNLATARQRKNLEEISETIYKQAINIANLAKSYEQKNQWTQALSTWRRASTYIQQIPENTFYYEKAKSISDNYNNYLRQARGKLQIAIVLQKASADLEKICAASPIICDRTVSIQVMKVYLTPAYVNGVRRTAMTAGLSGDAKTLAGVDDHLKTLQLALEAISENAGIPLEIYDHKRTLIGRYVPKPIANQ